MDETLLSVGLDVGTTSTQMILSELTLKNQASSFAVPQMEITRKKVLYESPIYLTPLLDESHIDGHGVGEIVRKEYARAGITREQVDTGAIIITGETSRKENAEAVLKGLSDLAGDFVVATAGPDLESRLAAKGSGAAAYSEKTGKTVLHMDIGGGTSNLALIRAGEILDTGCLNVGGRLLTYGENGKILWISKALAGMTDLKAGDTLLEAGARELAESLTQVLEMAAGRRPPDQRLYELVTREGKLPDQSLFEEGMVISFSGGVADCMAAKIPWNTFSDLGPLLGQAIVKSRLCRESYLLGEQTIRATVIGAGCHSAQLSGSTVFHQNIRFPLKNIPAIPVREDDLCQMEPFEEGPVVLAMKGISSPGYREIEQLADRLAAMPGKGPLLICLQQDMAKALGQALALRLGKDAEILCMDRILMEEGSYLDVACPVGPAIPVVVKTLILRERKRP